MAYHFNNRIEIIQEQADPDAFMPDSPMIQTTVAKPWADIKTIRGNELDIWNITVSEEPIRFIIRYRKGINTTQKVKYNGKLFNINSVANDNGRNQTLTIFAVYKG